MIPSNIDRIFALYQALYGFKGNKFVPDTAPPSQVVQASSPLAPFVKDQDGTTWEAKGYYNSKDVEDRTKLGFATPGVKTLDEQGRNDLAQYIANVYLW